MSVVISIRIRKELKEKAEKLGINIRDVVEKAIEEKEMEELRKTAEEIAKLMEGISPEEWARAVREIRNER